MPIANQYRFPSVKFLSPDKIKAVGSVGEAKLVVLGFYPWSDTPVIAKSYSNNPASENLWASDLWELLARAQEKVTIPEEIKAADFQ